MILVHCVSMVYGHLRVSRSQSMQTHSADISITPSPDNETTLTQNQQSSGGLEGWSEQDPADDWEFTGYNTGYVDRKISSMNKCNKTLLPSFLYLGRGHSGSTSFAVDLDNHPKLSFGAMKEHRCIFSHLKEGPRCNEDDTEERIGEFSGNKLKRE